MEFLRITRVEGRGTIDSGTAENIPATVSRYRILKIASSRKKKNGCDVGHENKKAASRSFNPCDGLLSVFLPPR